MEARLKIVVFYHNKDIDMLEIDCTLTNLGNICRQIFTDTKFYPFTKADKHLLEKARKDVVFGASIVFTRKALADETFFSKVCKHMHLNCGACC